MSNHKTVLLVGDNGTWQEHEAVGAITPGELVEVTAGADIGAGAVSGAGVKRHSTAAAPNAVNVAVEDDLQGKGIEDDYAAGDRVRHVRPLPGHEFNGILKAEENVVDGDPLESNGAGRLVKAAGATNLICREDLDLTGGVDTRCIVEVAN